MFTMNCTRHASTPDDLAFAYKYLSIHSAGGYNIDTWTGMYFPTMIDTASTSRMARLTQPIAIHDELLPQLPVVVDRTRIFAELRG